MSEELQEAIDALQGDDEARAQRAFATIAEIARRDPGESAVELSRAVLAEHAAGALRTPRLLTLLGLTRVPVPQCLPVCLDLLRALASTETQPPADAALGVAVIVARTQPRALLPEIASIQSDPQAAQVMDRQIAQAPIRLLSITSKFLRALPDSAVTEMARWLWCDCATLDLMTLADFVGLHLEKSGADDPIVALMVDLAERVPATADEKRYTGQRLQESGVDVAVIEQLRTVWRAIRVAPALDSATIGQPSVLDPSHLSPSRVSMNGWPPLVKAMTLASNWRALRSTRCSRRGIRQPRSRGGQQLLSMRYRCGGAEPTSTGHWSDLALRCASATNKYQWFRHRCFGGGSTRLSCWIRTARGSRSIC